jgi:hypothetical protein
VCIVGITRPKDRWFQLDLDPPGLRRSVPAPGDRSVEWAEP